MQMNTKSAGYAQSDLTSLLEDVSYAPTVADLVDIEHKEDPFVKKAKKKKAKKAKNDKLKNDKAIQSFFRIVTRKQVEQISQVDYKANILITLCSLLASVVGSLFLAHYEVYQVFTPSVVVLTSFSIISVFFAMLVIVSPTCPNSQAKQKGPSVINFNQFSSLDWKDYKKAVNKTLKNEEEIYETLSEDLYRTGKVLKQKYKFISWAYRVFLAGIFIAFLWGLYVKVI